MRNLIRSLSLGIVWVLSQSALAADLTDVNQIVDQANLAAYYKGVDGRSEARMVITDGQGRTQTRQFTILRYDRADGGDQDFLVAFSRPADVRNTVFMVAKHIESDDDRWLYLPSLDLVKRISAGDKRTSFVGSHYFYEDVSGRNITEDRHQLVETTEQHYVVDNTPKDPASVEFSQYRVWIDKANMLPQKIEYKDRADRLYRRVEVLEVQEIQGHPTVTKSRVSDLVSGGNTTMEFRFIKYDVGLDSSVFTERSLRKLPLQWLRRP
ncbi:outer membrane lipoprotein-sorting protein [Pontibacterium granulatum]|uniref:outer membrane lipoprotein-sorting protein n=1 Tax=Pontibacterium granulatum TaxID=2036029 RepID=UPI002499B1E1|nr:outer membrane lipoprotein-sorting protein [Pontibacterium granulatum]MDI3325388.1 outer membrane lipoprotein-sorting protein [Pontibacterium granulatum]